MISEINNAAIAYGTKTIKGFKPWKQINRYNVLTFKKGAEWSINNLKQELNPKIKYPLAKVFVFGVVIGILIGAIIF